MKIALCGNPNSGKTTLFNSLTGANQKVGNWAGVTVEKKSGLWISDKNISIVDTPGAYSLSASTLDEKITCDFLKNEKPDVVVNIVDSTNLTRSLFLTTQLLELKIPIVVALNMTDELLPLGISLDTKKLEQQLGCKFCPISAAKNQGIDELLQACKIAKAPAKTPFFSGKSLTEKASQRYGYIHNIVSQCQKQTNVQKTKASTTERIDKIVLNKWLAYPIFAAVMFLVFFLSLGGLGAILSDFISNQLAPTVVSFFTSFLSDPIVISLLESTLNGVFGVIAFLPQIMLLFGLISVLEASGYMSRIAFIMDKLLCKIGLGGKSFVSMVLGCGCSVPAIMSTRTIKNVEERNATITLSPFIPCNAKMAIISFFVAKIFGGNALIAVGFYFLSIVTVIFGGLILKMFGKKQNSPKDVFILELPVYRLPTFKNVGKQMWERGKSFLVKAGTVILLASIALWFLQSFDFAFQFVEAENSILASIGKIVAPLFAPLGFGDWRFAVATLSGIVAKETVVSTLTILLGGQSVSAVLSPVAAFAFVAYNLLTVPCISAVAVSFSEQGNPKNGLKSLAFQAAVAYAVAFVLFHVGNAVWSK